MSANKIRTIPTDAFTGLVSLRSLDLSFNQLRKLDNKTNGVIDDCLSLETVNKLLHRIEYTSNYLPIFNHLPCFARSIWATTNSVSSHRKHSRPVHGCRTVYARSIWVTMRCRCWPMIWRLVRPKLKHWTFLTMWSTKFDEVSAMQIEWKSTSFNNFNFFDIFSDVLSRLEQVETLDLSHNELKDLKSEEFNFTLPGNLTRLYFGSNQLTEFPSEAFANLSIVHEISLENNAITEFDLSLLKSVRKGLTLNIHGKLSIQSF